MLKCFLLAAFALTLFLALSADASARNFLFFSLVLYFLYFYSFPFGVCFVLRCVELRCESVVLMVMVGLFI